MLSVSSPQLTTSDFPDSVCALSYLGKSKMSCASPLDLTSRFVRCSEKDTGPGRWRKMKGVALVRLGNGLVRRVELHWYEVHGIGRRDFKIKRYVDEP